MPRALSRLGPVCDLLNGFIESRSGMAVGGMQLDTGDKLYQGRSVNVQVRSRGRVLLGHDLEPLTRTSSHL